MIEEKTNLIDTEKKYYDLEKHTKTDLQVATTELKDKQDNLEKISKNLSFNNKEKDFYNYLQNINQKIINTKNYLENDERTKALEEIKNINTSIDNETKKFETSIASTSEDNITKLMNSIKI